MRRGGDGEAELVLDSAENGGFDAAKGEIEAVDFWNWEMIFVWVALLDLFGDVWAARVGKAENFGDFVKTFAYGVVTRAADDFEMIVAFHVDNLGVTTTDNGCKKRELWIVTAEPVGVDVGFEVVSRIERLVVKDGEGAGGKGADEEAADEARSMSDGDSVDAVDSFIGVTERLFDDWIDGLDMAAGGNFWDDAAVFGVDIDLRHNNIGQDFLAVFNNCCGGFVARRFDTENFHLYNYTAKGFLSPAG